MSYKFSRLIDVAREKMAICNDPIHDLGHVERVVKISKDLGQSYELKTMHIQALELAAWWHDVGRTVTKRPSILWMVFVDDTISAIMLCWQTIRRGLFGGVPGLASRIIFCNSFVTGKFFSKILLSKKTRMLLNILHDADTIDILSTNRMEQVLDLVMKSRLYLVGYRFLAWWNFSTSELAMRTKAGKKYIMSFFKKFLDWMRAPQVYCWHVRHFGQEWFVKNTCRVEQYILRARVLYL
ncbi:MAG: hypothetical protein COX81_00635 [Candidatus Magasanikbacteria bacterium CG_4_10_14_0_2_um_filter_37_12]|uniref:HD domain-containing protein n=1 Tax=Candidatus Magasanikbacteria bacterium CG_4_10_14_0_2_um_filter_37_12 TaxID=1974637 RepID=A0A2M7V9N5_9BACT|nr:MAG: hypothetical protein COX81_00635 [Candidatus Magasanikbacteria bacterium CG_4_10_14_0_2_um_filter_37_12]